MIKTFTTHTDSLNDEEMRLMPIIAYGLSKHIGEGNAVTNKQIRAGLAKRYNINLADSRIRKIINYIRINAVVKRLIATSEGYYIATTREEMQNYIDSLTGRIEAIEVVRQAMQAQMI